MGLRTNLFPYPSVEESLAWISNTNVNVAFSNTAYSGLKGVLAERTTNNGVVSMLYGCVPGYGPTVESFSVTPGDVYTFSCYVQNSFGSPLVQVALHFQTNTAFLSSVVGTTTVVNATWKRISVTGTVPAGATKMGLEVLNSSSVSVGVGFIADGFLLEKSSVLGSWFSGSSLNAAGFYYAWTGTPNGSPSTESTIPPGVTPLLSDDFNRANSNTVGAPQIGPTPVVANGTMSINNEQLKAAVAVGQMYWDLGTPEVEISCAMYNLTTAYALGIMLGTGTALTSDYYWISANTQGTTLFRNGPGGLPSLITSTIKTAAANGSVLKVSYKAGIIRAYIDNVLVIRWGLDYPMTSNLHGVRLANTSVAVENLLGVAAPNLTEDRTNGARFDVASSLLATDTSVGQAFLYKGRDTKIQDEAEEA